MAKHVLPVVWRLELFLEYHHALFASIINPGAKHASAVEVGHHCTFSEAIFDTDYTTFALASLLPPLFGTMLKYTFGSSHTRHRNRQWKRWEGKAGHRGSCTSCRCFKEGITVTYEDVRQGRGSATQDTLLPVPERATPWRAERGLIGCSLAVSPREDIGR